jgi:flagellar protein FliO/FliZ
VADLVLVVGATEEQVTLLAEVDPEAVEQSLRERRVARVGAHSADAEVGASVEKPALVARSSSGALAGSVFDRDGWGTFVHSLRERTVRRS